MTEIEQVFIKRDNMSISEANNRLQEMRLAILYGEDPEEVLYEEGLELDYFLDLI